MGQFNPQPHQPYKWAQATTTYKAYTPTNPYP